MLGKNMVVFLDFFFFVNIFIFSCSGSGSRRVHPDTLQTGLLSAHMSAPIQPVCSRCVRTDAAEVKSSKLLFVETPR